MSFKKIEDIQYLYENLNSNEEELVELLEVLEDHLKESGYSDRAIECFIETADVHDVESHIQLSSLDEGAKLKLLKKLGTGAWNIIKKQGRKLKDTVKRNTPVKLRTGVKDTIKNTKDSVTKTGDKVKNAIKNNPKKSAIAGAGALTVGAFATGGDPKDNEDEKISKQVDDYVDKNKGDKPIRKIDPTPYNRQEKSKSKVVPGSEKIIPARPANPSGKELPKARTIGPDKGQINPNSARGKMIAQNKERFGGDKVEKLRDKNAAFQKAKKKGSGYSMDDFAKDFPNSNTAKERRKRNRVTSVMDMESYDAFDIVSNYLIESNQVENMDEALYVMSEMDATTIQGIVSEYTMVE